ncbi:MAG TPA: monovalent cation/H(+) antiporter subunit G [Solirubrobacterales bacterium]
MLETLLDIVSIAALALGLGLATVGLVGLARFDGIANQLHAAGLVAGPGLFLVLFAAIGTGKAESITSALLVALFVLITAPLSAHAIAQADRRRRENPDED